MFERSKSSWMMVSVHCYVVWLCVTRLIYHHHVYLGGALLFSPSTCRLVLWFYGRSLVEGYYSITAWKRLRSLVNCYEIDYLQLNF